MKRLFAALLVLALLLSLCACDQVESLIHQLQGEESGTPEVPEESASPEEPEDSHKKNPDYTTIVGDDPIRPGGYPPQYHQQPTPQPQPVPDPQPTPEPEPEPSKPTKPDNITVTAEQMRKIEDEFLALINAERSRLGLCTLTPNNTLAGFAQIRAEEIVSVFSHTRPNGEQWNTVIDTAAYPYVTAGENLVITSHVGDQAYSPNKDYWIGSPEQITAAAGWIYKLFVESPVHYENIINEKFEESGIGITYVMDSTGSVPIFYLTHLFGVQ